MAKKTKVIIEQDVKGTPKLKQATEETKKQAKALDERTRASKRATKADQTRYTHEKQAIIGTAPAAKNFSKMARSMDGGTGAGGLVRAYALLAANVFALSAAFGVLSRAAQTDTLMEAMVVLEKTTGQAVNAVGRELQRVTGYGMDLAESMRATSLALSAGFDSSSITELGQVARNAAVSLGRPMGDALDRIFRGVIKVEPELLDEIGLFVRVKDASARYASELGVAASTLTEFEKRQAFANEAIRQGKDKFEDFADIDTDQFSRLAAAFADVAQATLSWINWGMKPLVDLFANSGTAITFLFTAIVGILLQKAIPAMGVFSVSAKKAASDAVQANRDYQNDLNVGANNQRAKAYEMVDAEKDKTKGILAEQRKQRKAIGGDYAGQAKPAGADSRLGKANLRLQEKGIKGERKITALQEKQKALASSRRGSTKKAIAAAIKGLEKEIKLEQKMLDLTEKRGKIKGDFPSVTPIEGKIAHRRGQDLQRKEIFATGIQNIASKGEFQGFTASFKELKREWKEMPAIAEKQKVPLNAFQKGLFGIKGAGTVAAIGIKQVGMAVQAAMGWIMLAMPLFMWFIKYMGIGNKAHKKYQEAHSKTADTLEHMSEKMEHQTSVLRDNATTSGQWVEANFAFTKNLAISAQAVVDSMEAWDEFQKKGSDFAIWWENFKTSIMGGGVEEQQEFFLENALRGIDQMEDSTKAILAPYGDMVELSSQLGKNNKVDKKAMQERLDLAEEYRNSLQGQTGSTVMKGAATWTKAGAKRLIDIGEFIGPGNEEKTFQEVKDILDNIITEATGMLDQTMGTDMIKKIIADIPEDERGELVKVLAGDTKQHDEASDRLKSIATSAIDVARAFGDTFVTKTDLDKPLAIFQQLAQEGRELTDNTTARAKWLKEIEKSDSAIAALMTMAEKKAYAAAEGEQAKLKVIDEVEKRYIKQQLLLKTSKNLTKQIVAQNKILKAVTAKVGEVSNMTVKNDLKKLDIAQKLKEQTTDNALANMNLSRETEGLVDVMKQGVMTEKEWADAAEKFKISTADLADIKAHFIDEDIIKTDISIKQATAQHEINLAINKTLKARIDAEDKLLKVKLKMFEADMKYKKFTETGDTTLNVQEESKLILEGERVRLQMVEKRAEIEKNIIDAQYGILEATIKTMMPAIKLYNESLTADDRDLGFTKLDPESLIADIQTAKSVLKDTITDASELAGKEFANKYIQALVKGLRTDFATEIKSFTEQGGTFSSMMSVGNVMADLKMASSKENQENDPRYIEARSKQKIEATKAEGDAMIKALDSVVAHVKKNEDALKMRIMTDSLLSFADAIKEFGAGGELAATMAEFTVGMIGAFDKMNEAVEKGVDSTVAKLAVAAYAIQGIASIVAAAGKNKIAVIDQEIAKEQQRDGKSKESLARIKQLEAQKEKIAKRNFDTQKKLAMANVILSTAMAVMQVWTNPVDWFKTWAGMMTPLILGLGAAQLAIISGTQYAGGGSISGGAAKPASIEIGKRSNKVDVSKAASSGELAYLSDQRGVGTNANNFRPMGGASGLRKGYAEGGYLVGERGPEMMYPTGGFNVVPNDDLGGGAVNANFTINAIDAAGVEEVLLGQQGNIISMIRSAANDYGEDFIESVNTDYLNTGTGGDG